MLHTTSPGMDTSHIPQILISMNTSAGISLGKMEVFKEVPNRDILCNLLPDTLYCGMMGVVLAKTANIYDTSYKGETE